MEGYLGQIMIFAGNFNPKNWMYCNGAFLPISQNQELFAIIGTTYGGDGRSTFKLPDLQGRAPIGAGSGGGLTTINVGELGGTNKTTLKVNNLPAHNHTLIASNSVGDTASPQGSYFSISGGAKFSGSVEAGIPVEGQIGSGALAKQLVDGKTSESGSVSGSVTTYPYSNSMASQAVMADTTIGETGGSDAFDNMQPFLGVHYIICVDGMFPSRS